MVTKDKLYVMRDENYKNGLLSLINHLNINNDTKKMTMIEIGSYAGESTEIFSKYFKKVIAIDPFLNDYDPNDVTCQYMDLNLVYNVFKERISKCDNVELIKKTSDEAINDLIGSKYDFIYIDGMHTYNQVKKDIENYLPLLNNNCFIGGHDYHPVWQGVVDAIHEKLGNPDSVFSDTSWLKFIKRKKMFINIVTPCSRPENLHKISQSINIPKENYRWIVVFDRDELPDSKLIPDNCEVYLHRDSKSIVGHAQRNFALDIIHDGYVYFNDDDTILHKDLWENIKYVDDDFISFQQLNKDGSLRLNGDKVDLNHIDSHNFIFKKSVVNGITFRIDYYGADGIFAKSCYDNSKTKKYINKPLSVYNLLR